MMNIKIKSPIPEADVIATFPFGSQVYGTATKDSDHDFVKLLDLSIDSGNLLLQYQRGPQPKVEMIDEHTKLFLMDDLEPGVDYIYVSTKNFWHLINNGGNTQFFECLHTPEFKAWFEEHNEDGGSCYNLTWDHKAILKKYTDRMAKGYLGVAKRDLTYPGREKHVARSIWMAKKIIARELINLQDVAHIPELEGSIAEIAEEISTLRKGLVYE